MSENTKSTNWGAVSLGSAAGSVTLGARGTVYVFQNFDNSDRFIFLLADLGFGGRELLHKRKYDPSSYTKITANIPFSASDLNWSNGGEATIGIAALIAGASATSVSAWPLFLPGPPVPGAEVNNDYFTGQVLYGTNDVGLSASVAYQFIGMWILITVL
jgi:hypothetical protein